MKVHPVQPITEDNTYILITAVNHGSSPTTITHFCGYYAPNFWDLIRGKKQQFIVNTHPALGKTIPYVLAPGEEWSSMANQSEFQENNSSGYLYIGVIHNQKKRPVYKRVKINS